MRWNEDTGEWEVNPDRFEEKYGMKPVERESAFQDAMDRDIEALKDDLGVIEEQKPVESMTMNDIMSIDPVTGRLSIDQEAYYRKYGVYPILEDVVPRKEAVDSVIDGQGDGATKPMDYWYPKEADKWNEEYERRYGRYNPYWTQGEWEADRRQPVAAVAA